MPYRQTVCKLQTTELSLVECVPAVAVIFPACGILTRTSGNPADIHSLTQTLLRHFAASVHHSSDRIRRLRTTAKMACVLSSGTSHGTHRDFSGHLNLRFARLLRLLMQRMSANGATCVQGYTRVTQKTHRHVFIQMLCDESESKSALAC